MAPPRRGLIVAPSWVGDAVMATPAFVALRAAWPAAHLTLVCRPGIDQVLANLRSNDRDVFDSIVVDRMGGAFGPARAGLRLRRPRADCAVLFPNSFRTALAVRISGATRRVGYARDGRGALLTDRVAPPSARPTSTVDSYCDLVERGLGVRVADRRPRLGISEADARAAHVALAGLAPPIALLVPGGNNAMKRWPPERFAAVADALVRTRGFTVAVSGSPRESDTLQAVLAAARVPITNLAERTGDLGTLKAIVSSAALVVTNDTGPRHIAAAFAVPTVALFGPTDHRWTTLRDVPEQVLNAEPFLPEELVADDRAAFCRIDRISVGDVVAAIDTVLSRAARLAQP
ncbi:MAG: lipopolysaccharide heptosyltransferase II [Phycisphaerae bacterium]|nr:lipopolysaccharide heptosyltransferase II [Phycisphaerae bacterium]